MALPAMDGAARSASLRALTSWSGLRAAVALAPPRRGAAAAASDAPPTPLPPSASMPALELLDQARVPPPPSSVLAFAPLDARYDAGDVLGTGGYAVVRRCTDRETGEELAVKVMHLKATTRAKDEAEEEETEEPSTSTIDEVLNEVSLVAKLHHPNIVRIHQCLLHDGLCYIVMERLDGPELMDALYDLPDGKYSEAEVKEVLRAVLDAVSYMHSRGCVHRDLKLENLVLRTPGDLASVVIVDFGLAAAARAREKMEDMCGTPWYAAPEILLGKPYTASVDCWACGVGLYALLTGEWPFDFDDEEDLADAIVNEEACYDDMTCSSAALDLLKGLLRKDPNERLTAAEALEHAWFADPSTPTRVAASRTSDSLRHVHRRLENLASSNPRLPRVVFRPGEQLVTAGEESTCVYLILSGEAAVLAGGGVRVGTRRAGNFVGEAPVDGEDDGCERPGAPASPSADARPDDGAVIAEAASDPNLLSTLNTLNAWVGGRRSTTVSAVTTVRAVQLDRAAMAWAVDPDYRVASEFQDALRRRRLTVAKAERAERTARVVALKAGMDSVIREFLDNAEDVEEVAGQLTKVLGVSGPGDEGIFVKRLVVAALDRASPRRYELTARALCALHGRGLTADGVDAGVRALLSSLDDLQLDFPHAPAVLALILARLSVDEVVAPALLPSLAREFVGASGEAVAIQAAALVHSRHGAERVLRAWGGGGAGTTTHAREAIDALLAEFVLAVDAREALRLLRELGMPHYSHEFVLRLLIRVAEAECLHRRASADRSAPGETAGRLLDLLAAAREQGAVSDDQYALGRRRFVDRLEDLDLDVPGVQQLWRASMVAWVAK